MLIASKIVEQNPASYDVLCLSYNENEKYDYYFNRLSLVCENSYRFVVYSENKIYRIFDFIRFKFYLFKILKNKYSKIYLASIDNPFFHLLLSVVKKDQVLTFDDGTANIYQESNYYKSQNKSILQRIILNSLGNKYSTKKVVDESQKHFSIYKGYKNIIDNTSYISIIPVADLPLSDKKIKIFLGQPFHDLKGGDAEKVLSFIKKIGVDYYFPHPREKKRYDEINYIDSPLIFEDYILNLLTEGYFVELYTVLSTAALNVASLKNVEIIVLYEENLGRNYTEFYQLFETIDCKILNF
ncbi:CMP-N-acetylneuraminate-beta-galactosamide-alpha-2,3-sialyltransferase [compost metagenome]